MKLRPGQARFRDSLRRQAHEARQSWLDGLATCGDLLRAIELSLRYSGFGQANWLRRDEYAVPGISEEAQYVHDIIRSNDERIEQYRFGLELIDMLQAGGVLAGEAAATRARAELRSLMAWKFREARSGILAAAFQHNDPTRLVPPPEAMEIAPPRPEW